MELIRHFSKLSKENVTIAGGKGASLGEMTQAGIPVPEGFVVLSTTFDRFIEETHLDVELDAILDKVNYQEMQSIEDASEKIKGLILTAKMPEDLEKDIKVNFKKLGAKFVAVRSSATSEDSSTAAWAGQLDSFLNTTESTLFENVKRCWASLFTPRAIFYREEKNLHNTKISVAVVVQKMVDSGCSGIAFSVHPVTQDENQAIIEAGFGLGEAIVSGQITPDSYVMEKEPRRIIDKNLATQERGLYRVSTGGNEWRTIPEEKGAQQVLSDKEILELTELILKIEKHYGFPCDIEWAREKNKFYIVQSRPITTLTDKKKQKNLNKWAIIAKDFNSYYFRNSVWAKGINGARTILPFLTKDADSALAIEGVDGDIFYLYDKKKWADMHKQFTEKIDEDPNFLAKVIEETNDYSEKVNLEARKIFEKGFQNKTSKELIENLEKMIGWQEKIYAYGVLLPLLDLAENAYVEEKTKNILKIRLKKQEVDKEFQIISYPNEETFAFKQEKDFLNLAQKFYENKELRALVLKNDGEGLIKIISKDYKEYFKLVQEHTKKHAWVYYSFIGPAYDEKKFLELIKNELSEKQTPEQKLKKILEDKDLHIKEKINLIKKLSLDVKEKKILELAGTFVWAKPTRKDYQSQLDYYMIEGIIAEISKRTKISRKLLLSCPIEDIKSALNGKVIDIKKLESIFAHHVIAPDNNEFKLYYGDAIQEISSDIEQEHIEVESSHVIKGTVAMRGFGKGLARIINKSEDMGKMQKGDILISVATTPSIVPVMKLAAAIVTDEGGLTCHAAIVSRELGTPCVIGTKNATRIIRDGDLIEIDANNGEVRIIKRAERAEASVKKILSKIFSREESLIYFSMWDESDRKGMKLLGENINNNLFIIPGKDKIGSVWYESEEIKNLRAKTLENFRNSKNNSAWLEIKSLAEKSWKFIEPYANKKKIIKNVKEFEEYYNHLCNFWVCLNSIFYEVIDNTETDSEIKTYLNNFRAKTEKYTEIMSAILTDYLKLQSVLKEICNVITFSEALMILKNKISKENLEKIKSRLAGCFMINGEVHNLDQLDKILNEKGLVLESSESSKNSTRINLIKMFTREHALFTFLSSWGVGAGKGKQSWIGIEPKLIVFLKENTGSKVSVWYNSQEFNELYSSTKQKIISDKTYFDKIKKEFYYYWDLILPLVKKKQPITLQELKKIYPSLINWWTPMAVIYILPDIAEASKEIREEAEKIRNEFQEYADEMDSMFIRFFEKTYPNYKDLTYLITPEEVFSLESQALSKDKVNEIKARAKNYLAINDKVYSSEDSKLVLAEYEFNSANKIKLIKQQSREHSLAYFYVWQKANQEFSGEFFDKAKTLVFYNSGIGKRTEIYYDEKELQNIFDESGKRAGKDKSFFEKVKKEYYLYLNKNLPYIEGKKSVKNIKELEEMYSNWIAWWARMAIIFVLPESKTAPKDIAAEALRIRSETEKYSDAGDRTFIELFKKLKPKFKQYAELMTPEEIFSCDNLSSKQLETILGRNKGYIILNGKISTENSLAELLEKNNLFILELKDEQTQILTGQTAHPGKVKGRVRVISSKNNLGKFVSGEILVAEMTSPDYVPVMKKAAAIITDEGGKMCHAAIVARELKIPCVVGTKLATQLLHDGDLVEVDANKGIVRILNSVNNFIKDQELDKTENWAEQGKWVQSPLSNILFALWHKTQVVKDVLPELDFNTIFVIDHYAFQYAKDRDNLYSYLKKGYKENSLNNTSRLIDVHATKIFKELEAELNKGDAYLKKNIDHFMKIYTEFAAIWSIVSYVGDLPTKIAKEVGYVSSEAELFAKVHPHLRETWIEREVNDAVSIANLFIKKYPSEGLESVQKLISKDKELSKLIKEYIEKYVWCHINKWIGEPLSEEQAYKRVKEEIQNIKQGNHIKIKHDQGKENTLDGLIQLSLSTAYWRAECGRMEMMTAYRLRNLLEEIARKNNISYQQVLLLSSSELVGVIKDKNHKILNKDKVLDRQVEYLCTITREGNEVILTNKDSDFSVLKKLYILREIKKDHGGLLKGIGASPGYAKGIVRVVESPEHYKLFKAGEILVSDQTTPSFVPLMRMALAIVTGKGGITSHAAIVSRELKKPCVIDVRDVNKILKDGDLIEVDATKGEVRILNKNEEKAEPKENQNSDDPWILAQEITKMHILFFCMVHYMAKWWPKYKLTDNFKEIIAHFEGTHVKMYCKQSDYSKAAKDVADKILKDPAWALKQLSKIEELSDKFILNSNKLVSLKTSDMKELAKQFAKTSNYNLESQVFGAAFTWLTEARYELVTKRVIEIIQEQIKKNNSQDDPIMVFNTLTKSEKKSHSFNEELDFLEIINKIRANPPIKNRFSEESEEKLLDYVLQKKDSISKAINNLHDRWCWLSYGYTGPEKKLEEYIRDLKKAIKEGLDPKEVLKNNKSKDEELIKKQKEMVNRLKFNKDQMNLINFVKESSFIKDYRKGAVYHGMYSYKRFFDYVSKLTGIASDSFWHMNPFEIEALLEKDIRISPEEIKKRAERCTLVYKRDSAEFLFDEAEKKLLDSMVLETNEVNETELKGMPVSMGLVRGRAKLIESTDDLGKMNQGDILISHITYPSLVPAMKKAGAIVTNIGGVICHAAIIARELNIPCVVGTKFATKLIKDNDLIEVDANKGEVRIISRDSKPTQTIPDLEELKKRDLSIEHIDCRWLYMDIPSYCFTTSPLNSNLPFSFVSTFVNGLQMDWITDRADHSIITKDLLERDNKTKDYFSDLHKNWLKEFEKMFSFYYSEMNSDYSKLSDKELKLKLQSVWNMYTEQSAFPAMIDAFMFYSDQKLTELLKKFKEENKIEESVNKLFSVISAPTAESFLNEVENELIEIALDKKKGLNITKRIDNHCEKYSYFNVSYGDYNPYTKEEVIQKIEELSKKDHLKKSFPAEENKVNKELLKKKYAFSKEILQLVRLTELFTKWQDERKQLTLTHIGIEAKMIEEISKRRKLDLELLKCCRYKDLYHLLDGNKLPSEALSRLKNPTLAFFVNGECVKEISGKPASEAMVSFKGVKDDKISSIYGLTAYLGKVIGRAKIVRTFEDAKKVKEGDILVIPMTRPEHTPIMKKAAAIVTDDGGITCHAAIIARELKKPCIIGTKIATRILNDGDLIEVNANHGLVKILEKAK